MIDSLIDCIPLAVRSVEKTTLDKVALMQFQNNGRHLLLETEKGLKFWMTFKRDFFNSFGNVFGLSGVGESINKEILDKAIVLNVSTILFIHKSGDNADVYVISPIEFRNYAEKAKTERETESKEITCSVPVSLLRRI